MSAGVSVVESAFASPLLPPAALPPAPLSLDPPLPLPPLPLPPVPPPSLPLAPPVPLLLLLLQPLVITNPPPSASPPTNTNAARPLPSFLNMPATNPFRRIVKSQKRSFAAVTKRL
jgi:hypothetical protein